MIENSRPQQPTRTWRKRIGRPSRRAMVIAMAAIAGEAMAMRSAAPTMSQARFSARWGPVRPRPGTSIRARSPRECARGEGPARSKKRGTTSTCTPSAIDSRSELTSWESRPGEKATIRRSTWCERTTWERSSRSPRSGGSPFSQACESGSPSMRPTTVRWSLRWRLARQITRRATSPDPTSSTRSTPVAGWRSQAQRPSSHPAGNATAMAAIWERSTDHPAAAETVIDSHESTMPSTSRRRANISRLPSRRRRCW